MQSWSQQAIKVLSLVVILCIIGFCPLLARKSGSIVICAETGKVHHEHNADVLIHPASLTKIMTLYMTFKALHNNKLTLHQKLPVSRHASQQAPSKLWLKPGSTITVRDAILACTTKSANDAAVVLAEALGNGSETTFAKLMTNEARKLGMKSTVFKNASGLPNKQHSTTARDMAILSQATYKHFPTYYKFFKERQFVYKGQVYGNHNHLLGKVKGVDGIKTGFTNASGFNLAASMKRNNNSRIIAVVLGGDTRHARDKKTTHLLEATYKNLHGTKPPQNQDNYSSIEDLIYEIASIDAESETEKPQKAKLQKGVYLSNSGQIKTLKDEFSTVDGLLNAIDERSSPRIIKATKSTHASKTKQKAKRQPSAKKKKAIKNPRVKKKKRHST